MPGTRFGTYTADTNKDKFKNDRLPGLVVVTEVASQKLMWGKSIQVEIRELKSFSPSFPRKSNNNWNGVSKYGPVEYYPTTSDGAVSVIGGDLYNSFKNKLTTTEAYAAAFANVTSETDISFENYLTRIRWDSSLGEWVFTKRDGSDVSYAVCDKIILYYAEPAYISIENNTNLSVEQRKFTISALTVSGMSAINSNTETGYGYVISKDGATRSALLPLTADDCAIKAGGSLKLMIPGGCNMDYTLKGDFIPTSSIATVDVIHTIEKEEGGQYVTDYETEEDTLLSTIAEDGLTYKTLHTPGQTHEVIFEKRKPICKIVLDDVVSDAVLNEYVSARPLTRVDNGTGFEGHEYLFSSISEAVTFANKHNLRVDTLNNQTITRVNTSGTTLQKGAVIQMLVDYLLPGTDKVDNLKSGSAYTFTTAKRNANVSNDQYYYTGEGNAVISRDAGNKNSLIEFEASEADLQWSKLTVTGLDFDGKNLAGSNDGGAIKTHNCAVDLKDAKFDNFVASNGGAVFIEFGRAAPKTNDPYNLKPIYKDTTLYQYAIMSVTNVDFTDCTSDSTTNRQGGGAIWTNARVLELATCEFVDCVADDQGGAVFHRIDEFIEFEVGDEKLHTETKVEDCTFSGSQARAAGAIESDASKVTISDSQFYDCIATQRNGGGVNIYSNNNSNTGNYSEVTVTDCLFDNCHANDGTGQNCHGGGLRSAAKVTTVQGCTFTNCSGLRGGAFAASNTTGSSSLTVKGCTISDCYALFLSNTDENTRSSGCGGGIYCTPKTLTIENYGSTRTSITNCTAEQSGGGIYHPGSTLTATNCTITRCTAGTAGTDTKLGGGVYTTAGNATLTGCTIRDNTSAGSGGGIYQNGTSRITLDKCIVTGNTSGEKGGGVFTKAHMTLRNDSYIMSNQLSNTDRSNAAGVWLENEKILTVGTDNATSLDASTIKDNYTSAGQASNLRLSMDTAAGRNSTNSVNVRCGLSGEIYVLNAAVKTSQFGSSQIASPAGFTDIRHVFRSDDGKLYGVIDRADTAGKRIIWAGDPICKITDGDGNILYFADGSSAVFDALDVGDSTKTTRSSAFSLLRAADPNLYTDSACTQKYNGSTYCVKMLVEEYEVERYISTAEMSSRTVILTTAGSTDSDGYTYRGAPGSQAQIIRGYGLGNVDMMTVKLDMILRNVVLDGGGYAVGRNNLSGYTNYRNLVVNAPDADVLIEGTAAVQNAAVSYSDPSNPDSKENWLPGGGAGVYIKKGSVQLDGTIQDCSSLDNGGGVYVGQEGRFIMTDTAVIKNCAAANGGGVYTKGSAVMDGGSITNCRAETNSALDGMSAANGGGVYAAPRGSGSTEPSFEMYGGSITSCGYDASRVSVVTVSGGAVFVADNAGMRMGGGSIQANSARTHGGGIAVGGNDDDTPAKVIFSGAPVVTGNRLQDGSTCNMELDQDTNLIINSDGLSKDALIGIYVTGSMDEEGGLFSKHGEVGDPFGTFTSDSNLRCFVNDRNNLRGGVKDGGDANTIYWIQVYFLEVGKTVLSDSSADKDVEFEFEITLEGTGTDVDGNDIDASEITNNTSKKYGDIPFYRGQATVTLKDGEKLLAENLPKGFTFTVKENLTTEQQDHYTTYPAKDEHGDIVVTGTIGQDAKGNPSYLSSAEIKNIHAVCKITAPNLPGPLNNYGLLYYRDGNNYEPAVYLKLSTAFSTVNKSASRYLYYDTGTTNADGSKKYARYDYNNGYRIEMLIPEYSMTEPVTLDSNRTVTLTTANKDALDGYPYAGGDSTAVVKRGYDGASLFTANGALTLSKITLDGGTSTTGTSYAGNANGGLVKVGGTGLNNANASLSVGIDATLHRSTTSGNGGAVYIYTGASATVTSGIIEDNHTTGDGAGIYVENNGTLYLSGDPDFGSGNSRSGAIKNGGTDYTSTRQDIYLKGTGEPLTSLVLKGSLTNIENGSIWVWAQDGDPDGVNHYVMLNQFAVLDRNVTLSDETYEKFRNARADSDTGCGGDYLTGQRGDDMGGRACIYWSGGFDVFFQKVNGYGEPLSDAVFTVYKEYNSSSGALSDPLNMVFTERKTDGTYQTVKGNTATSGDEDVWYTVKNGGSTETKHLTDGEVLLGKVPPNKEGEHYYYMKETGNPSSTTYRDNTNVYRLKVTAPTAQNPNAVLTMWVRTGEAGAADEWTLMEKFGTGDSARYRVLNEFAEPKDRQVILRKVERGNYKALEGAHFRIFRPDLIEVTEGQPTGKTYYESLASGVYFVGDLPEGRYYLLETQAPTGAGAANAGKVFALTVDGTEQGTTLTVLHQVSAAAGAADAENSIFNAFKTWASETKFTPPATP